MNLVAHCTVRTFLLTLHIAVELKQSPNVLKVVVIYRPPSSPFGTFLEELIKLFEETCLGDKHMIIIGDINVHYENHSDNSNIQYKELLYAFGLEQHVKYPTHNKGHILDHVISRPSDILSVSNVTIGSQMSDHFTVLFDISLKKNLPFRKHLYHIEK